MGKTKTTTDGVRPNSEDKIIPKFKRLITCRIVIFTILFGMKKGAQTPEIRNFARLLFSNRQRAKTISVISRMRIRELYKCLENKMEKTKQPKFKCPPHIIYVPPGISPWLNIMIYAGDMIYITRFAGNDIQTSDILLVCDIKFAEYLQKKFGQVNSEGY